jgi:hypothetical protein
MVMKMTMLMKRMLMVRTDARESETGHSQVLRPPCTEGTSNAKVVTQRGGRGEGKGFE